MLSVRKNLTEILLEVTNEEISAIAQDTLSKVRIKGQNKLQITFRYVIVVCLDKKKYSRRKKIEETVNIESFVRF